MQPGDTITPETPKNHSEGAVGELKIARETPSTDIETSPEPPIAVTEDAEATNSSVPVPAQAKPEAYMEPSQPNNEPQEEVASAWQYKENPATPESQASTDPITWTASEFVHHEKDNSWFMGLAVVTGVIVAVTFLLTRDWLTTVAIVVAAMLFGVTATRKPRAQQYQLTKAGVGIGDKFHEYNTFKSFSVMDEDHFRSIRLAPLKRFALPITLYYPPEEEERLLTMIGNYLPYEKRNPDPVDRLMHKVRF